MIKRIMETNKYWLCVWSYGGVSVSRSSLRLSSQWEVFRVLFCFDDLMKGERNQDSDGMSPLNRIV